MFNFAIANAAGIDSERKALAVLRVHLQALLNAVVIDDVDVALVEAFGRRWSRRARSQAPARAMMARFLRIPLFSFGELLRWYKDSLLESDFFSSRRLANLRMAGLEPWSFQTHLALEWWFDPAAVPQAAVTSPTPTEVRRIEDAFNNRRGIRPGAVVGKPRSTLWLTYELGAADRTPGSAKSLRDALGLFDRGASEFAFLVRLAPKIADLLNVKAPTAFDAGGYARFRSWPGNRPATDADAGRTYDLDPVRRGGSADHGRAEMVVAPRALMDCSELVGIGYIGSDADDSAQGHSAFADDVCGSMGIADLLKRLRAL